MAQDRDSLEAAYTRIDEMEPEAFESISFRPRHSLHHYPLAVFAILYILLFSIMTLISWKHAFSSRPTRKADRFKEA
jgi:Ca-activated chloride channel family protein